MAKSVINLVAVGAVLLLAACTSGGEQPPPTSTSVAAPARPAEAATTGDSTATSAANRPAAPTDAETQRRRELRQMILDQVEPCLREELARIDDPRAVGAMVVVFGFEPTGEATTARLSDEALERYEADAAYREVANAIMTGVVACAPLQGMPVNEHNEWGLFPLVFGPLEA